MPIITNIQCFAGYPLQALDPALATALARNRTKNTCNSIVTRLECYLQVTQQTLSLDELSSDLGQNKISGFISALYSNRFHQNQRPWFFAQNLKMALSAVGVNHASFLYYPCTLNIDSWTSDFLAKVRAFDSAELDTERVDFWRGWVVNSADGRITNMVFWPIYLRYGAKVTEEVFNATRMYFLGGPRINGQVINQFARYLADYPNQVDFQNSKDLGRLLADFFSHYFRTAHSQGLNLSFVGHRWRAFCLFLEDHLLGKIWARPLPVLPRPIDKKSCGIRANIRKTTAGYEVKHSLVTEIPLHVSDLTAKELLFHQIRRDVDTLLRWARAEITDARGRLKQRRELASHGIVSFVGMSGKPTGLRYRVNRDNPDYLSHAAATFEARGFTHLGDGRAITMIYPPPASQTTWELGIPTHTLLLAHCTVLVAAHPIITTSFLEKLNLFDKDGRQTGLVETDAGWYLIGNKLRKGASKAEQRVLLNAETLQVVRDVIALTQPIREYLRAQGSDLWRRLFLATTSVAVMPTDWKPTRSASREVDWLAERFQKQTGIDAIEAEDLARRFSLRRLRSSAGVLVYLETGSVEQMAKALGHEHWRPTLLDRYLPRPVQEFFVERWIRLFQSGIICEALKDSPYLLEASNFQTMAELDLFLEHHALRRIPAHLEDPNIPDHINEVAPHPQFVFGIDVGTLTLLVSIKNAVYTAKQEPCGRAVMWARVAERLMTHLEAQTEQPEFHSIVAAAKRHADPCKVESLIYG
jgi:hypothetical protein